MKPNPFAKKPVALVSAAYSFSGGSRCQYDMRKILVGSNSYVMTSNQVMINNSYLKFDKDLNLTCEESKKALKDQIEAFVEWIALFKRAGEAK